MRHLDDSLLLHSGWLASGGWGKRPVPRGQTIRSPALSGLMAHPTVTVE